MTSSEDGQGISMACSPTIAAGSAMARSLRCSQTDESTVSLVSTNLPVNRTGLYSIVTIAGDGSLMRSDSSVVLKEFKPLNELVDELSYCVQLFSHWHPSTCRRPLNINSH